MKKQIGYLACLTGSLALMGAGLLGLGGALHAQVGGGAPDAACFVALPGGGNRHAGCIDLDPNCVAQGTVCVIGGSAVAATYRNHYVEGTYEYCKVGYTTFCRYDATSSVCLDWDAWDEFNFCQNFMCVGKQWVADCTTL